MDTLDIQLKRMDVPSTFMPELDTDPGYCYTSCYYGTEKKIKMAYLIGRFPTWGKVLSVGGFDNRLVTMLRNRDGTYHISESTGCGYAPKTLNIPRNAIVGSMATNMWDRLLVLLVTFAFFGVWAALMAVPLLMIDKMVEKQVKLGFIKLPSLEQFGLSVFLIFVLGNSVTAEVVNTISPLHTEAGQVVDLYSDTVTLSTFVVGAVEADLVKHYDFVKSPTHNEYCVQASVYGGKPLRDWLNNPNVDNNAHLSCVNVDKFDMDILKLDTGQSPDGFHEVHETVLASYSENLPPELLCISSDLVREKLLSVESRRVGDYLQAICTNLPKGEGWLKSARMVSIRRKAKRTVKVKVKKKKVRRTTSDKAGKMKKIQSKTAQVEDSDFSDIGESVANMIMALQKNAVKDVNLVTAIGQSTHNMGIDTVNAMTEKIVETHGEVLQQIGTVFDTTKEIVYNHVESVQNVAETAAKISTTVVNVTTEVIDHVTEMVTAENVIYYANSARSFTKDVVNPALEYAPNLTDLSEETGKMMKWTHDQTEALVTTSGKLVSSSNDVLREIVEQSPNSSKIGEEFWKLPSKVKFGFFSVFNTNNTKTTVDVLKDAVEGVPWLTETMGKTMAGPVKGFYENMPAFTNFTKWKEKQEIKRLNKDTSGKKPWFSGNMLTFFDVSSTPDNFMQYFQPVVIIILLCHLFYAVDKNGR